jgi:hypothetical protein
LNTSNNLGSLPGNNISNVPPAILQNASTLDTNQSFIKISVAQGPNLNANNLQLLPICHFAEINQSNPNRRFDIYINDVRMFSNFSPSQFKVDSLYKIGQFMQNGYTYISLNKTASSGIPPLINALEVYSLVPMDNLTTDSDDGKIMYILHVHCTFVMYVADSHDHVVSNANDRGLTSRLLKIFDST